MIREGKPYTPQQRRLTHYRPRHLLCRVQTILYRATYSHHVFCLARQTWWLQERTPVEQTPLRGRLGWPRGQRGSCGIGRGGLGSTTQMALSFSCSRVTPPPWGPWGWMGTRACWPLYRVDSIPSQKNKTKSAVRLATGVGVDFKLSKIKD